MSANGEPKREPADPELFEKAIRDNLSPEAIALSFAFLQVTEMYEPKTDRQRAALKQVQWLAEAFSDLLGADELARLLDELGL